MSDYATMLHQEDQKGDEYDNAEFEISTRRV